jgi:endonuclease/exonuclease/phosphatase family metal-dependent hydrolase
MINGVCGDFNMILNAADKNNDRLNRRSMSRFKAFVNHALLEEIVLTGRSYTWSNGADRPTLERLDRVFVTADWINRFPNHLLKPLSSDCSDHCPLLLHFDALGRNKRRFRFEAF